MVPFTKMHGIGNDYVYIDTEQYPIGDPEELAVQISDRHFGVGADGLVLIMPSKTADFRMRMFNADGSESEMCGNAVRCIARYVYERGKTSSTEIALETAGGIKTLTLELNPLDEKNVVAVTVDMGEPELLPSRIPVTLDTETAIEYPVEVAGHRYKMTCVSMGNPHAVIFVDEHPKEIMLEVGPKIEVHKLFPNRVNAGFARVLKRDHMELCVWERGSGATLACGTGAAAAIVAAVLTARVERECRITLPGGDLELKWCEKSNRVYKTGPATFVFDGQYQRPE